MFGTGLAAAAELRRRILERLGAEPEWTEGNHDSVEMRWTSGPVTTFFTVEPGAEAAPDLAVLRVMTAVATVGDAGLALDQCNVLNFVTTTNRWVIGPTYLDEETPILHVSCAFVVGRHSLASLEGFALWCVREQIATATAKMTNDIASLLGGVPVRIPGHEGGDYRDDSDGWHEVVYHYDHVVSPNRDLSSAPLLAVLGDVFEDLKQEMFAQDTGAWLSAGEVDADGFVCEMPFSWDSYPAGVIGGGAAFGGEMPPTVLVTCTTEPHAHVGNGLLLRMRAPAELGDKPGEVVNQLNLSDRAVPGATHSVGAWVAAGTQLAYCAYLPAVLAEQGIDLAAVMREMLLTLARQALIARRLLLDEENLTDQDRSAAIGLAAPAVPHGLAWGETGEGRNLGAEVLTDIFDKCVGDDTDWADTRPDGFIWWPYHQAQEITAIPHNSEGHDSDQGTVLRIATDVRRDVPVTPEALETIAAVNTELSQSVLVLRNDGSLILACRVFIHAGIQWWASRWTRFLAADQFIEARELGDRLADLGQAATSAHPRSGHRPEPDELFGIRENYLIPAAAEVRAGLADLVPLIAITGQYALPHEMSVVGDGSLDFTWHPSQQHVPTGTDPAVRVQVKRGESPAGMGWVVRSHAPVAGDAVTRARWCNNRNVELFGARDSDDLTVVGGWGTAPGGTCCLTTWQSPHFVRDEALQAAGLVGNLLRYHQNIVLRALMTDPGAVTSDPLTAEYLSAGLGSVISAFAEVLEYPEGTDWSAEAREAGTLVTLEGRTWADEPLAEMAYDAAADPDSEESGIRPPHSFRMALMVPLGYNRTELSLLYSALLAYTQTATRPGEADGFPSGWYARMLPSMLESDGWLQRDDDDEFTFSVGEEGRAQARFEVEYVKFGPNPVQSALWMYDPHSMRIAGVVPDSDAKVFEVADGDVIGTWARRRDGLAYEIVIPPIPAVWPVSFMLEETLSWIGRHVIERVQAAVAR